MVETSGTRELINPAKIRHDLERFIRGYPLTARMQHYKNGAIKRLESEQDPRVRDLAGRVIKSADTALQAYENGDFDHFAQEFERVIRHSIILQLPEFEEAIKTKLRSDTGKRKLGFRGSLYRMLECFFWDLDLSEPDQLFRHWIKAAASKTIESNDGRKWRYKSVQIHYPEGEDSEHPRNFEYFYAENGNWKKATIANIKITFERVCDEANLD